MNTTRRLAAILTADVVGYSRLVSADEADALARLGTLRRDIIEPNITKHSGRLFKIMGDGFLAEFASAVQAVTCAIAIQKETEQAAVTLDDARKMRLRIGVHVGDVIIEGDDLLGDGVNIAARLEGIAAAGGVSISRAVHDQVRDRVDAAFDDKGEIALKNIARPVQVFALAGAKQPAANPIERATVLTLPDKPSIAVLPFQNMSGDPEQEYFADGMVEDIITALSRFKSLFVIARNSSFTFKGKTVDIKQVGRELGVRYVLEGSVRKSGNRVRITGQLIDAGTGAHLWADRFDGGLEDIFDLQDQVTAQIIGLIAPKVEQAEIERAKRKSTSNLDSYDYFLRGMASFNHTREGVEIALRNFSKAIEIDPSFAAPHAWATIAYTRRKTARWMSDDRVETAEGVQHARRAIDLGKDDAVALAAGGFGLAFLSGEIDAGLALVDRALILNPNLAGAWHASGWIRAYIGEPETAVTHLAHAMRLSPLDPESVQIWMATSLALRCAGRYDESAAWAKKVLQDSPDYVPGYRNYAISSALAGHLEEARAATARALQLDPSLRISTLPLQNILRRPEDLSNYCRGARLAGMPE